MGDVPERSAKGTGRAGRRPPSEGGPDFDRLGDLLGGVAPLGGEGSCADDASRAGSGVGPACVSGLSPTATADLSRRIATVWAEVVGQEIAGNTEPVRLKDRRLVVATSSSAWAQTLQFMGSEIVERLNGLLGGEAVDSVTFRHAGWDGRVGKTGSSGPGRDQGPAAAEGAAARRGLVGEDPSAAHEDAAALTADERAALAEVEAMDLAPQIKDRILRGMRDSFVRSKQESGR